MELHKDRPICPEEHAEATALVNTLWDLLNRCRLMLEQAGLNSTNSSIPPSQDRPLCQDSCRVY